MEVSGVMSSALDPSGAKAARPRPGALDPVLAGATLLALALAGLRLYALGDWSLWLDEALTLADGKTGGLESNPVGYTLFNWIYALAPGRPDEWWLRLPAALFGIASILGTLWAFRPLIGGRASALAAFFVAASVWHLYWSQTARFYTLAQALALFGSGLLLRGLYGDSRRRTAGGLLLVGLAALTHPSAAFLIGPLLAVPWIARWLEWIPPRASESRAWGLFSAAGLAAIVLGSGWALRAWLRWEARQGAGDPVHFLKTAGYLVTPGLGLAFLVGALLRWRERESFVTVLVTVGGLLTAGVASFFVRVSAQYIFVLQPWIAACAALALTPRQGALESRGARLRRLLLILLVALPGLFESGLYFTVRHGDRPAWREAYAYVFEHRGPRDLVFGMEAPVAEYYLNPRAEALRDWQAVTWLDDWRARLPLDWARYGRRMWFVVNETQFDDWGSTPGSESNRTEVQRFLRDECTRAASFEVPMTPRDLDVHVYVSKAP